MLDTLTRWDTRRRMTAGDEELSGSAIEDLEALYQRWPVLDECAAAAKRKRVQIANVIAKAKLVPSDCALVTFGSLARDEFTQGSDIDWTLLVDGTADPQHLQTSQRIAEVIAKKGRKPGPTGIFGGLTFSHDLVHLIGGDQDTNKNTTRRVLLLLESRAIAGAEVRDRVLRHLGRRYLEEDAGRRPGEAHVPHFLLNDIVRYWRTMCVDFAAKQRDRAGEGWALRNIKLRMSRKLIFAAGLAMCLRCELRPSAHARKTLRGGKVDEYHSVLVNDLLASANRTPLDLLTRFALDFGAKVTARKLLDVYSAFLDILRDKKKRDQLEGLRADDAAGDATFEMARDVGRTFHGLLLKLFFGTNRVITKTTQRYGVF